MLQKSDEAERRMKRYNSIALLEQLYELAALQIPDESGQKSVIIKDYKTQITTSVRSSAEQHRILYKVQNKGFEHLFSKWALQLQAQPIVPAILDKAEAEIQKSKLKQEAI